MAGEKQTVEIELNNDHVTFMRIMKDDYIIPTESKVMRTSWITYKKIKMYMTPYLNKPDAYVANRLSEKNKLGTNWVQNGKKEKPRFLESGLFRA